LQHIIRNIYTKIN